MKRTALFILACAALIMSGCAKEKKSSGPVSTYKIFVDKNANVVLPDEQSITASFYPKTEDDAVNTDITVTFKADPSLVSKYTERKDAKALPATNYLFTANPVIIEAERRVPSDEDYCKLKLIHSADLEPDAFYVLPIVIESITGNANATFDPNDILFITVKTTRQGAGKGTPEEPFKIETIDHLKTMAEYSVEGKTTYFKLLNDLDFTEVENWDPINLDSDNTFNIDFDGDKKTIKNFKCTDKEGASIFGYVSGNIHDLNIDNAVVTAKNSSVDIAILANTFGSNVEGVNSTCENVNITKSNVTAAELAYNADPINQAFIAVNARNATFKNIVLDNSNHMTLYYAKSMSSGLRAGGLVALGSALCDFIQCGNAVDLLGYNQKNIGGIVGALWSGHISECWNTGKVEGNEDVAGIVGQMGTKKNGSADTDTWTVTDCYNKGQIKVTGHRGGGICGCPFNSVTLERCYNTGDVIPMCRRNETGQMDPDDLDARSIGGIAGFVCGGAGIWDFNVANHVSIINCHVFSALIKADTRKKTDPVKDPRPGCGAIVGYTSLLNTYTDCFRSTATKIDNDMTYIKRDPFEQGNCSPEQPLNPCGITPVQKMPLPYDGKSTEETLLQVATRLGWFTGDSKWTDTNPPTLKNNPEPAQVTMVARYR